MRLRRCIRCRLSSLVWAVVFLSFFPFSRAVSRAQDFSATTVGNYGDITVMEVEGNYDANNPDGSTNGVPREEIAKEFYATHPDTYDFLVIFSNFDFQMPEQEVVAFYLGVKNDTQGIGLPVFDNSSFYGSDGKLQGTIDMGSIGNLAADPLDPGFTTTMTTLAHEVLHRWAAHVKFQKADGSLSSELLGSGGYHWSFLLDTAGSLLYGNRWQDNGDGTFTSLPGWKYYSPLDLYLMGLIDRSEVPPMLLIENPDIDQQRLPEPGVTIDGAARTVTIDEIIAAEGDRIPGAEESQKTFKTGFILITRPNSFTGDELNEIRSIMQNWVMWFSSLTDGRAIVQIDSAPLEDIPANPGVNPPVYDPRTAPPEINDGVAWLMSEQGADGSWLDLTQTSERDTAEAVLALSHFDIATDSVATGIGWLGSTPRLNTDYLSRKIVTFYRAGMEVSSLVADLLSRQNPGGGWGSDLNYISNPTDTSFALKALAVSGYTAGTPVETALEYLKLAQGPEGGWGNTSQASTVEATANVLSAFNLYRTAYSLDEEMQRGIAWLVSRQNSDGGFGNSPSTVYDSATALLTLRQFNVSPEITGNSLDYLRGLQSEDGSWYGSAYQTALAVSAIWSATIDPDLALSNTDISFTPPSVTSLPAQVEVRAEISNLGLTAVDQVTVALYQTSVSDANRVGTQTVAVPGKSAATATFTVTISDGNPHWYYVIVDPDNLIPESSEANNKVIKILYPETTYDLEVLNISASPSVVDLTQDVTITSQVANNGAADVYNVPLRYYLDTIGGPFEVATLAVNVPAGTTIEHQITWTADMVGENLNLAVMADPFEAFGELSEENNQAFTVVSINQPTEPNLSVLHQDIQITPTPALESGSAQIAALVRNQGFSQADNIEVVFYKSAAGGEMEPLGSKTISSLAAGESTTVTLDWTDIMESGERIITVRVDPQDLVQETKEEDNSAFTTLQILSLPDLAVSSNSIVFDPPAPKDGDPVSIQVTVQNAGEQEVHNLMLAVTVSNEVISLPAIASISGNSQTSLSFDYDTTGRSGIHQVSVVVDPDNQIQEQEENNNSASRSFGVQDGNLWLTQRYISPNGDSIQDLTQFFFRLEKAQTVSIVVRDEESEVIRTFTGEEFHSTSGGTIEWDGRDDFGMVVDDGQYNIEVVGENGSVVAGLPVVVDTNRSPLTKAIGTEYLLNANLTCLLPNLSNWEWFLDESGIILNISSYDSDAPEFTPGFYTVSPDGEDILRLVPWEWGQQDHPQYSHTITNYAISPDREKVAFALQKYDKFTGLYVKRELWVVDRYGENLVNLASYDYSKINESFYDIKWSPDSKTILYSVFYREYYSTYGYNTGYQYWLINADGTGKTRLHPQAGESGVYSRLEYLEWSPDSRTLACRNRVLDESWVTVSNKIITIDTSGNKQDVFEVPDSLRYLKWLNDSKVIVKLADASDTVWLLDVSGQGNHVNIAAGVDRYTDDVFVSPTGGYFAFIDTSTESRTLMIYDAAGIGHTLIDSPGFDYEDTIIDLSWSRDGSKLAFFDRAYRELDVDLYEAAFVVADVRTMDLAAFNDGTWEYGGGYGYAAAENFATDAGEFVQEESTYSSGSLQWFAAGNSLLARDSKGIFVLSTRDGDKTYLPLEDYYYWQERISPLGRYVGYNLGVDSQSVCYLRGSRDLWAMSSLLNLTADLRISRDKSGIILKGIATDLNFVGYKLEYADTNTPDGWTYITPPANVPVVNDVFTTWVPPYEGTFYVKLTVEDRAGNVAWERKRVSWGRFTSITNLKKSEEIFSPNNDETKDTVELRYRVLEPVHLEFYLLDENDTLLRTL
jgi:subtilase family serine protease